MSRLLSWKSGTTALMTMIITTGAATPFFTFSPAQAQYNLNNLNRRNNPNNVNTPNNVNNYNQYGTVTIPANVTLPVTYEKEKVIVSPGETSAITLRIANDIIDSNRNVLIPANTQIVGELQPVNLDNGGYSTDRNNNSNKGVRFIARELIFPSGQRQSINASSATITRTEKISKGAGTGQILTDAAIGAGAASVLALLTGNKKIEILEPIGGAAAGALTSVLLRKQQVDVFVLRPEQDLDITLQSNLVLTRN